MQFVAHTESFMIRCSKVIVVLLASLSFFTHTIQALSIPDHVRAVVADVTRPDTDKQRDVNRKPAETLAFIGIKSGAQVGELLPGSGYFTRLFSKLVGPKGHVYAFVTERSANAPADMPDRSLAVRAIAADPHYSNVSVESVSFAKLSTPVPVDMIFTAQNYHDLHNIPGLSLEDFNKSVFAALKPGGIYIVLDHSAASSSGTRDTNTLHRIDVEVVKKEVEAAGFKFLASSNLLANPGDTRSTKVFDPAVRGTTDQFLLKFRKPGR